MTAVCGALVRLRRGSASVDDNFSFEQYLPKIVLAVLIGNVVALGAVESDKHVTIRRCITLGVLLSKVDCKRE